MKSLFASILTLVSLQATAGGFPIDFGKIENVINDVQKIDKITSKNKPHVCRISSSWTGNFEAKGSTLADAKYNTLSQCKSYSGDPFFCKEPSDDACEKISDAELNPHAPAPAPTPTPAPEKTAVCVKKNKVCEGDLFACEYDNGAKQQIYITKAFATSRGEYVVADFETNGSKVEYDLQVSSKNIDLNACERVKKGLETTPL